MPELLDDPVVLGIAKVIGRTPAQVLLRWATQDNITVIPKSLHECVLNGISISLTDTHRSDRLAENFALNFTLSDDHMQALYALNRSKAPRASDA